ncbi:MULTISPECIES: conjugative transposon protein TraM [Bacteroidales]|uniref:Conjugative transposon TraM protein n=17 Tax=Bacteria TaxID=2 RepID=A0A7W6HU07_9BACT|nr:conjugative transposon protein TraM [Butyricimonas faecihominis]KAB1509003.1 conjugative transposon protein TraM [Butyricimonas faecihominis]MBB4024953.1 conjugative transposon TraM protein [Butyricimonas faecihominis]WOF08502.1 conjugative transposon protein TraM [Butyricimonas faecihominis]BEI55352.1 conjugative transposon protein TraM [Butyricimonas faecihominis]GGJ15584.1 conjugative transposon protein TraM [Butyricimonas faecihominis]
MEEVQKNENGTTVPQTDGKPEKEKKPKRELTPQQVQQRRKMIVFPLMFLAFAGCMYLIFAPSGKEDVNVESVGGFNADIPLPAEDGIIADKQKAYEQAMISRKQQDKIQSLQDFGFTGDDETEEPQAEIDLMPEEEPKSQRGGGASYSANAYRDINRQLSTFYETPAVDEEKEDLKRQVAELTDRLQQQQNATPTADDQMALLEKSYELAAKYMNDGGQNRERGQIAQIPTAGQNGGGIGTPAIPVQAIRETTVSGLQQPMSNADFIRAYSQPRNYGFNTAVGTGYAMGRNTIAACIHQDQTLTDGQAVKLRLLEPMQAGNIVVPKNTLVAGTAKVQGERLDILVSSIEYAGNIIPVELAVFDTDGQKGLSVPSSMEQEAFNEAMANIGSGLGTSISFAQSAGQQVAMDVTRGLLQGTSGYLAKKFRTVKVKLKAGYKVMLYAKQQ